MPKHAVHYSLDSALEALRADKETVLEMDRWAEIGDSGATELAGALRTNENLEVLILGSQNIGPAGAQVLVPGPVPLPRFHAVLREHCTPQTPLVDPFPARRWETCCAGTCG
jgi:hypothetical protein